MKITQLLICSAALALPLTLNAATKKNDDRWFEVEIILFSQLGDKSQLKENFPQTSELPKYRQFEDLLSSYLNPNISSLKQLLPVCNLPNIDKTSVQKIAKLPAIFQRKSLAELEQSTNEQAADGTTSTGTLVAEANNDSVPVITPVITSQNPEYAKRDIKTALNDSTLNKSTRDQADLTLTTALTEKENAKVQQLVLLAFNEFQALKFKFSPERQFNVLCKIDESQFAQFQVNNPDFDYYGFDIDAVPLLIDAQEVTPNNNTHLLGKTSLQLNDIIQDLRYSKNFRPVLHMGWRQVARPKKQSVPVKVFAGENFNINFQQELQRYNAAQLAQAEQIQTHVESTPENEQLIAAKQARIQQIIQQLANVPQDTDTLITSLENQNPVLSISDENYRSAVKTAPPLPPIQKWLIEGFFNIHLKHYLFITADFTILDKNLAELASAKLAASLPKSDDALNETNHQKSIQPKAIRFKQNRRVISGEVHYFDHPYMGMIVQIRPYSPPEPALSENH